MMTEAPKTFDYEAEHHMFLILMAQSCGWETDRILEALGTDEGQKEICAAYRKSKAA